MPDAEPAPRTAGPADKTSQPPMPRAFLAEGNAERHLMEADTLRRRQLYAAMLHGTGRSWRQRRQVWVAALVGLAAVAVAIAVIGVANAFDRQARINQEQEQRLHPSVPPTAVSPAATLRPPTSGTRK